MTWLVMVHTVSIMMMLSCGYFASSLHINVMVLFNSIGKLANMTRIRQLAPIWETHINSKSAIDSNWPFTISVETFEITTDCSVLPKVMFARLNNRFLPNITAIVAEGDYCVKGAHASTIAASYGIPIILTTYNPDSITDNYRMPESQGTSFLMNAPTVYKYKQLIRSYMLFGVKSIVAVANFGNTNYNTHSCMGAADDLEARGVIVLGRYIIAATDSTPRVIEIVNLIKQLNPDAVLWCDRAACRTAKVAAQFLPLQIFKDANYLPKALSMIDCIDSNGIADKSK